MGRTRDDAAGECFDKCARAMGFPYPGGVHIDNASANGDPTAFKLPRPIVAGNEFDFSFSTDMKDAEIKNIYITKEPEWFLR